MRLLNFDHLLLFILVTVHGKHDIFILTGVPVKSSEDKSFINDTCNLTGCNGRCLHPMKWRHGKFDAQTDCGAKGR